MANTQYSGPSYPGQVIAADVRYGETFLNLEFVDKAVPGEVLKDPMTGELYLRRSIDGKVVSFVQKSSTVVDFLNEFNIQFQSAEGFVYPDHPGSYLIGAKYDTNTLITHKRGQLVDIYTGNLLFPRDINADYNFIFNVSPETNGFFIKPNLRDGDRIGIGWLTGNFREYEFQNFQSAIRSFGDWLSMSLNYGSASLYETWKDLPGWVNSNGLMDYVLTVTGSGSSGSVITNTLTATSTIRLNEQSFIQFPADYAANIETITGIQIMINKMYFPKLQYAYDLSRNPLASNGLGNPFGMMIEPDLLAAIKTVDLYYFVTASSELPTGENRVIHQCLGYDFLVKGMNDLLTTAGTRSVQSSVYMPDIWGIDSIWMEEMRHLLGGGVSMESGSETTFKDLEKEIYAPSVEPILTDFTLLDSDREDIYVADKANL